VSSRWAQWLLWAYGAADRAGPSLKYAPLWNSDKFSLDLMSMIDLNHLKIHARLNSSDPGHQYSLSLWPGCDGRRPPGARKPWAVVGLYALRSGGQRTRKARLFGLGRPGRRTRIAGPLDHACPSHVASFALDKTLYEQGDWLLRPVSTVRQGWGWGRLSSEPGRRTTDVDVDYQLQQQLTTKQSGRSNLDAG